MELRSLPTVVSALELTAQNIMCGSVRMVYAVIYTLFLVSLYLASYGTLDSMMNERCAGLRLDYWV